MCSLNTVAPVSNWIINGIFYCSYLFICLSTTEEDNCIQYLSLFNLYTSSFIYSSKSFYFRYGDFRDLKKKIFLLAFTPCYSSLSSRYFLHTWQVSHVQKLVISSRCPCRKQILQGPSNFCSNTYHWATHQDRLDRAWLGLFKLLTLHFKLEN